MHRRPERLRSADAIALGLLHGPAELLPVSSSAHLTLLPALAGRDAVLAPGNRKAFEVALHAGTAVGIARPPEAPVAAVLASLAPPVVLGGLFAGWVERRLGTPRGIAAGLVAGSVAMTWADRRPAERSVVSATPWDGFVLGLAQAAALAPGVSRSGATLAAARALGFTRPAAWTLARDTGTPVVLGATALTAWRAVRAGVPRRLARPLVLGGIAAGLSGAAARRHAPRRAPLAPFAVYRVALAAVSARRLGPR